MNGRERGFLLLGSHLGDPDRPVLTAAQLRTLGRRVRSMEKPTEDRDLTWQDLLNLGYIIYFFEKACAISGYLLAVNPFNQPGVEAYKVNMFALLGKPGYEKQREELLKKISD